MQMQVCGVLQAPVQHTELAGWGEPLREGLPGNCHFLSPGDGGAQVWSEDTGLWRC